MIYKTLQRNLRIEQHEPTKTEVELRKGMQFLLH